MTRKPPIAIGIRGRTQLITYESSLQETGGFPRSTRAQAAGFLNKGIDAAVIIGNRYLETFRDPGNLQGRLSPTTRMGFDNRTDLLIWGKGR